MGRTRKKLGLSYVHPDSEQGAKTALADMSIIKKEQMGEASADPAVEGVWKVTLNERGRKKHGIDFCIVYLAGYKDPFGDVREVNDFESVYRES